MSITKRPTHTALAEFVAGAPDAFVEQKPVPTHTKTGKPGRPTKAEKPVQISIALPAELLAEVDQAAGALSISRAAFMKQALAKALQA
jgi:hypothetical protein